MENKNNTQVKKAFKNVWISKDLLFLLQGSNVSTGLEPLLRFMAEEKIEYSEVLRLLQTNQKQLLGQRLIIETLENLNMIKIQ